ncbi:hypothetical protein V3C99_008148 [Haemonchus contortus]
MMDSTASDPTSIQYPRQVPLKRRCDDVPGSPGSPPDIDREDELLFPDKSTPSHLRTILAWPLEERKQMYSASVLFKELSGEVSKLRLENAELKQRLSSFSSDVSVMSASNPLNCLRPVSSLVSVVNSYEKVERRRFVIITGISGSYVPVPFSRECTIIRLLGTYRSFIDRLLYSLGV